MNYTSLVALLYLLATAPALFSQTDYTANDTVPPYFGRFRYGANMGAYYPWRDENLADIAAGNPAKGVDGVGVDALRPLLSESFLDFWGYDIRLDAFQYYDSLGIRENVVFVGYPALQHQDQTRYCTDGPSELFANMYMPIWDNGENGTPVNDSNYFALYLWKMVSAYTPYVAFWEIWNEPDFDFVGNSSKQPGEEGNWWEHNPDPCHYALHAPVQHYVRLLRISYEVIKTIAPDDYVAIGGIGYPSFLDVVLRNTDNPLDGSVDSLYPLTGGAYFDVVSYHSYPHIDNSLRAWDDEIFGFKYFRHSDKAVEGMLARQAQMRSVLEKYGYDGETYPEKLWIITESNIPRVTFDEYLGSPEAQSNYIIKALVACQQNEIRQFHIYQLGDIEVDGKVTSEFFTMGLYASLDSVPPYQQRVNPVGIAYRTASTLLRDKYFDNGQTAKMQLPANVRGGAFRDAQGLYTYVLWAATEKDRSESASAVYSFPATMNLQSLLRREWDFGKFGITQLVNADNIKLTGSPVFLSDSRTGQFSPDIKRVELLCNPNPFDNTLHVKLELPEAMTATLGLYDMQGRVVSSFFTNLRLAKGEHTISLEGNDLAAGMYALRFSANGGRRVTCKVVKT